MSRRHHTGDRALYAALPGYRVQDTPLPAGQHFAERLDPAAVRAIQRFTKAAARHGFVLHTPEEVLRLLHDLSPRELPPGAAVPMELVRAARDTRRVLRRALEALEAGLSEGTLTPSAVAPSGSEAACGGLLADLLASPEYPNPSPRAGRADRAAEDGPAKSMEGQGDAVPPGLSREPATPGSMSTRPCVPESGDEVEQGAAP